MPCNCGIPFFFSNQNRYIASERCVRVLTEHFDQVPSPLHRTVLFAHPSPLPVAVLWAVVLVGLRSGCPSSLSSSKMASVKRSALFGLMFARLTLH